MSQSLNKPPPCHQIFHEPGNFQIGARLSPAAARRLSTTFEAFLSRGLRGRCGWGQPARAGLRLTALAALLGLLALGTTNLSAGGNQANPGILPPQSHPYANPADAG